MGIKVLFFFFFNLTPISPKKLIFGPKGQLFQAKLLKDDSPSISESTKLIDLKIKHNVRNLKYSFQVQYNDVATNPIWWTDAILKVSFWLFFSAILADEREKRN